MKQKPDSKKSLDTDLKSMPPEKLIEEVRKLRAGIRKHRDSSGHELCWHHPELWNLLPEKIALEIAVPEWSEFIPRCAAYRKSLEKIKKNMNLTKNLQR